MALTEKERMMLYLFLAIVAVLVLVWFIRDNRRTGHPTSAPSGSSSGSGGFHLPKRPDLANLPHLSDAQKKALRSMGAAQLASLKKRFCPVCQDSNGDCNCPPPVDCPPSDCPPARPTAQDAQNACAGQDITQGVPYTADCINAIFGVYGCNMPYPDPNTTPDQIKYNSDPNYNYYTPTDVMNDAKAWATWGDDTHRQGCYGPGGIPQ